MHSEDKIKKIFSSKLENFEPEVPGSMWDRIDNSLSAIEAQKVSVPKANNFRKLFLSTGIAASILLCVLFLLNTDSDEAKRMSFSTTTQKRITKDRPQPENLALYTDVVEHKTHSPQIISAKRNIIDNVLVEEPLSQPTITNVVPSAEDETIAYTGEKTSNDYPDKEEIKRKVAEFEREAYDRQNLFADNNTPSANTDKGNKSRGFAVGIEGGSGLSSENAVGSQATPLYSDFKFAAQSDMLSSPTINTEYDEPFLYDKRAVDLSHRQPVSFGLILNKNLSNHVSIESGIVYTYLHSTIKSISNSTYERAGTQYFHYLGIPLSINYNFAQWNKVDFYFTLGGMIQKDIAGKLKDAESLAGASGFEAYTRDDIRQEHPQLSVMTGVGVTYPIYKRLNLYSSIGGAYYFDAKNDYRTIFSDRQVQLDVNLGLKFEF